MRAGQLINLVCEGGCGGAATAAYDAAVRRWTRERHLTRQADFDSLFGRSLVHTPHIATGGRGEKGREEFQCQRCGSVRVFGWPVDGVTHPDVLDDPTTDVPVIAAAVDLESTVDA